MGSQKAEEEVLYPIGMVARMFKVSVATIRLYESEGLVLPHKSEGNHRYFTQGDIKRIECIRDYIENRGLNLAGIRMMLSAIPCWELKPCSEEDRKKCDVFGDSNDPCWILKNRGDACDQSAECKNCPVYLNSADCSNLKSILKKYWRSKEHDVANEKA